MLRNTLLFLFLFSLASCELIDPTPEPVTLFSVDEKLYARVELTNQSTNAFSYTVDWGDGAANTYSSITEVAKHQYSDNGIYNITVTSFSEDKRLSHTFAKDFTVQNAIGTGIVYTDVQLGENVDIYINNVFKGTLKQYFTSGTPDCGDSRGVNFYGPPGVYEVIVSVPKYNITSSAGTVTIRNEQCSKKVIR